MPRLAATCTESLTPFLALTPCASRAGLTSLLNPHRLFDSEWTLIGVRFTRGSDGSRDNYVLTVGSVADPVRVHRLGGGLGQRGAQEILGGLWTVLRLSGKLTDAARDRLQTFLSNHCTIESCSRRVLLHGRRWCLSPFRSIL